MKRIVMATKRRVKIRKVISGYVNPFVNLKEWREIVQSFTMKPLNKIDTRVRVIVEVME